MATIITLAEKTIVQNPFVQFDKWNKIHLISVTADPGFVSLGTSSADGRVSVRTVLLKEYNESGRQIRIEGIAGKVSSEESETYFSTIPRESQLSARASEQRYLAN